MYSNIKSKVFKSMANTWGGVLTNVCQYIFLKSDTSNMCACIVVVAMHAGLVPVSCLFMLPLEEHYASMINVMLECGEI